jgi:DNA-binding NtrC family response regulator
VPPLRQRREDIPELVEFFLDRCAQRLKRDPCTLESAAQDLLVNYDWPGNVRELENIVTRSSVLNNGVSVTADQLKRWLLGSPNTSDADSSAELPVGLSLEVMERKLIEATLDHYGGHRARTAKALGIGVRTLTGKLRQYGYAPREKSYSKAG